MTLQAIGAALPAALAVALSPFPVIGIVLILAGPHGRRNGPLFALGWLLGLLVLSVLVTVVFGGADDPDNASAAFADWLRVALGAGLIIAGLQSWRKRPRAGDEAKTPGWMASLDRATSLRALGLGLLLSSANPKVVILAIAAGAAMVEAGVHGVDLAVAIGSFVLIGSSTVIGAVLASAFGGRRGAALLESVRQFMVANNAVISMVILLILGAKVLGDGLGGLGR